MHTRLLQLLTPSAGPGPKKRHGPSLRRETVVFKPQPAVCGDNKRNGLILMNGRHLPFKYCPLTLNLEVVLELCKKKLRIKKEVPARKKWSRFCLRRAR